MFKKKLPTGTSSSPRGCSSILCCAYQIVFINDSIRKSKKILADEVTCATTLSKNALEKN